jgi:hypothetical protein
MSLKYQQKCHSEPFIDSHKWATVQALGIFGANLYYSLWTTIFHFRNRVVLLLGLNKDK